jgi:hypothetical protein
MLRTSFWLHCLRGTCVADGTCQTSTIHHSCLSISLNVAQKKLVPGVYSWEGDSWLNASICWKLPARCFLNPYPWINHSVHFLRNKKHKTSAWCYLGFKERERCAASEFLVCQNLKFSCGHHLFLLQPCTSQYLRFCCWKTLFSVNNTVINSCKKGNHHAPLIDATNTQHTHTLIHANCHFSHLHRAFVLFQ